MTADPDLGAAGSVLGSAPRTAPREPVADPSSAASGDPAEEVWRGGPERLDRALPELGLARSRSQATALIASGRVRIDGAVAAKPGVRVAPGARIGVRDRDHYVSRAAHKLLRALDLFDVDPAGRIALDLGASTGGFTQVLLERGAAAVQAIDVGHGQLAPEIRGDDRVRAVEGCNARELTPEALARDTGITAPPSLVTADLSFISLALVIPALVRCAAPDAECVLLIKPQFEVGRVRDGVVTNPDQWAAAIRTVRASAEANGLRMTGIERSPIAGGHGNREFLSCFSHGSERHRTEWEQRIEELCAP